MADENVIQKIVRSVVVQELKTALDSFKEALLGAIDQKNDDLRNDISQMKDEIVGELKMVREEQTMLNGRTAKINQIEKRIEKLEQIHPHGHAVA